MPLIQNISENYPFISLFSAIILILGLYQVGDILFKNKNLQNIFLEISDLNYQKIFIATNFILLIFYPIILFAKSNFFILIISFLIFVLGLYKLFLLFGVIFKNFKYVKIKISLNNLDEIIVYISIFGLFLLSISPNTHGDSLGYHFVVAQYIAENGFYPSDLTHFHARLSGSGEIIIAIGIIFGSEQFGSLIQFSGLISVFGVFQKISNKKKYFYFLLVATTPILLFLTSTAKPQLLHACGSILVFCWFVINEKENFKRKDELMKIFISLILLTVSINTKFNFILSSFILGLFIFNYSLKKNLIKELLIFIVLIFSFFYFPIIYWKFISFGGFIFSHIYSPVPLNIAGMVEFLEHLFEWGRHLNYLIILIPYNASYFTSSIGVAFIYLILMNLKNRNVKKCFYIVVFYLSIQYFFGQFIARSFVEPFFWIVVTTAKYGTIINTKYFDILCRAQSIVVIVAIFFGVYSLFPGSLTKKLKENILSNNATGYSLFKWANEKLDEEDVVISYHKAISLGKSKYIQMDFTRYVDLNDKNNINFVNEILRKNPTYFLTISYANQKPYLGIFKNCLGEMIYNKEQVGNFEARNPFNKGDYYNGHIYKFNIGKFPKCSLSPLEFYK